jgi:hypothetical protein
VVSAKPLSKEEFVQRYLTQESDDWVLPLSKLLCTKLHSNW